MERESTEQRKKSCGSTASHDGVTLNLKIQQHSCSAQNTFYSQSFKKDEQKKEGKQMR